jgi:hypothetical protein
LKRSDPSISSVKQKGKLFVTLRGGGGPQLIPAADATGAELKRTLDEVIARYSFSSDADLKKAVYLTAPMRLILRREKYENLNLYNAPIDFMAARIE